MHIALDISPLAYGTGVSKYCAELVKALSQIDQANHYTLIAGTIRQKGPFETYRASAQLPNNFTVKYIPLSPRLQGILWNDRNLVKLDWLVGEFDLYHSLDWSLAPTDKPTIITVHDIFFLKRPDLQKHPHQKTLENRLQTAKQKHLPVIAVSQATKRDLIEILDYPTENITVIHEALIDQHITTANWQQTKITYQLPDSYALMIGTLEPRKNIPATIAAFRKLNTDQHLVIVGRMGWEQLEAQPDPRIHFTGYVSDTELQAIWQHATAFLYPSLYEGFGLPILEAFHHQVPVLTSNNSSMKEIAADAAILVDPLNPDSLQTGLHQIMTLSPKQRQSLIAKADQQLTHFSWHQTAQQTLQLYKHVYNQTI